MAKTVLITGASSGIGLAFAQRFGGMGYDLILSARSQDKLETLAEEIRKNHGVKVWVFPVDLSMAGASQELYRQIKQSGLLVDVLINNAGFGVSGLFTAIDLRRQQQMIAVNIAALTELTYCALEDMVVGRQGTVINLASMAAFMPMGHTAVYAATKAYVLSFTQALAQEYKPMGIRFLAVCPGPTDTHFFDHVSRTGIRMRTAENVVDTTLKALANKGASYVIDGPLSRVGYGLLRLAPRRLSGYVGGKIFKREKRDGQ